MKRQSLHVKDNAIYDQFTKQQVIWTHGYGATDRYVTRNEWGALLLQWPVPTSIGPNGQLSRQSLRSKDKICWGPVPPGVETTRSLATWSRVVTVISHCASVGLS